MTTPSWSHLPSMPAAEDTPAQADDATRVVEAVWRIESTRVIAALARMVRDLTFAEELAQDALVTALERWPIDGVPDQPGAWLVTTARNRAIDIIRRRQTLDAKTAELGRDVEQRQLDDPGIDVDQLVLEQDFGGDDVLRLVFTTCHPGLSTQARVALTLRLLGGLTTDEIARAFLTTEATIAQRIVRAKRTLAKLRVDFEVPTGDERAERLGSVLEVVYLVFNEGYAATSGDDVVRPGLCADAIRLGRVLAQLAPSEPEVHGLVALMEIQASRLGARTDDRGEIVLLLDQDRARWDRLLIRRGLEALDRAIEVGGGALGPYGIQAAIAACHARARTAGETDWHEIARLYGLLASATQSPVVELNRAVAISMSDGPAAALEIVDTLVDLPALTSYHLLPSVRGDLLFRLDRLDEARVEFLRAAAMTDNLRERALLERRAAACAPSEA